MDDEPEDDADRDGFLPGRSAIEAFEAEQPSGREALLEAHSKALAHRRNTLAWLTIVGIGPTAIVAVLLALFLEGSGEVAMGLAALGAAVLALRGWRAHQEVREIEKELADPMDRS